jgi:large subunit ribosomal protein L22
MAQIEPFEVSAKLRYLQVSPQKARLVVDLVRGADALRALDVLRFMPNKAAEPVFKLIQSAIANAEENYGLDAEELYVRRIFVDDGPRNRLRPYGGRFGARGRFKPIIQRQSHVTVYLAERNPVEDYE